MATAAAGDEAGRAARLRVGAEAIGAPLSASQLDQLRQYLGLLERWNSVYNLSAIREPDAMLTQHLLDSLAAVAPLRRHAAGRPLRILDVGSGAGLPGVVLAVAQPNWSVTTVDSVAKKVAFVRQVVGALQLQNLRSIQGRIEAAAIEETFDIVISRAFAALRDFTALTQNRLAADGVWVAMKGHRPDAELADLGPGIGVLHVERLQIPGLTAERCLVWLRRA